MLGCREISNLDQIIFLSKHYGVDALENYVELCTLGTFFLQNFLHTGDIEEEGRLYYKNNFLSLLQQRFRTTFLSYNPPRIV